MEKLWAWSKAIAQPPGKEWESISLYIFTYTHTCAQARETLAQISSGLIKYGSYVQVTMVEVAILGFTVISALISGSWLMHGVGTPTRFETSKESQHSQ